MILLLDIGNTHTHAGLGGPRRVVRQMNLPSAHWADRRGSRPLERWLGKNRPTAVALCSVVPEITPRVREWAARTWGLSPLELSAQNVRGIGIDYPRPETIGPDRLANAIAARARYGAPALIVDFGTAVTLDVVDSRGNYVGGVIAPGLAAMTEYLHERTALLPRIRICDVRRAIGRSTEEAMRVGAVHGYRGLIRELVREVKAELGVRRLPVVATGGYARLMARGLAEIGAVDPNLTLDGLRRFWLGWQGPPSPELHAIPPRTAA
jgi:type III pantothenate kinase